jgi:hypothetical protein
MGDVERFTEEIEPPDGKGENSQKNKRILPEF